MKYHDWDEEKNLKLIQERGVSFEICLAHIEQGKILDIIENKTPYEHQRVYVLEMDEYVYYVPFVEDKEKVFLKTIISSRKATKKYLKP
ncbi:MAG: BrnT family toxin [Candidatus Yonathbacteria bacterium]|nr:BrnT family toxin [Candidatus Yonathbacteria bacterium]